jgi:hypothetical protein
VKLKDKRFGIYFLVIPLCVIIICLNSANAYGADKPYEVKITEVDGVKTIINPMHPRDGKAKLKLDYDLVLGDDEDGLSLIAKPYYIKVDSEGNIYYSDLSFLGVRIFDKQGALLRKLGRKGQGPGEFVRAYLFDIDGDRNVYILDSRQKKVSVFYFDGRLKEERKLEKKGFFQEIDVMDSLNIYLKMKEFTINEKISEKYSIVPYFCSILNFDPEKNSWDIFLREVDGYDIMKKMGEGTMGFQSRGQWVWKVVDSKTIVAGHNNKYQLGVYSLDGTLRYSFGRLSKRRLSQAKKGFFPKEVYEKIKYEVAFERLVIVDEMGRYWLRLPLKYDNQPFRIYDVFSPDGIYLKQVESKMRLACFKNGRVYGVAKSDDDDFLVVRAKIRKKIL